MKIRIFSLIALLAVAMFSFSACDIGLKDKTYNATENSYFEFTEIEGGYSISVKEGVELPKTVKLPTSYEDKAVIAVANSAFKNNTTIEKIIIPQGYKSIGIEAFAYCTSLTTAEIGNIGSSTNGLSIGTSAFNGCTSLKNIKLGDNVKSIDAYAFYETKITSVTMNKVESVGAKAFAKCGSLTRFYIPASLISIDESAFDGSDNVRYEVATSNTVYKIEDNKIVKK